ncbi:hypothetical protein B0H10DRAFT_1952688 [Mycena sp. CBHHK59/15]|nr:hypothetical protein B0H10DRAFT_1952688 [Mycena sp. CBHHK59/15]
MKISCHMKRTLMLYCASAFNPVTVTPHSMQRLKASDILDPGDRESYSISLVSRDDSSNVVILYYPAGRFSTHARGFHYYRPDPHGLPLAGSVRFRVTPDDSPSSFSHGKDLCYPSGCLWQLEVMLAHITTQKWTEALRDQLLHECLITSEQLALGPKVFGHRRFFHPQNIIYMFRLDQIFPIEFSRKGSASVVGSDRLQRVPLGHVFKARINRVETPPFNGSALVRFERSALPVQPAADPPPAHRADYRTCEEKKLRPQPGAATCGRRSVDSSALRCQTVVPWAYNVDKDTALGKALRLLWDTSYEWPHPKSIDYDTVPNETWQKTLPLLRSNDSEQLNIASSVLETPAHEQIARHVDFTIAERNGAHIQLNHDLKRAGVQHGESWNVPDEECLS